MKIIAKDSKEGKKLVHKFVTSYSHALTLPSLDDCYCKYSFAKLSAYNLCYELATGYCDMCNTSASGENKMVRILEDWGVLSFNSQMFTFGAVINCHSENFDFEELEYIVITKNKLLIIR